ncbi:agamous-like MADS-box protein AGL103 [Durio zibethinus]|uniref:Agamous-like MADS-box protein AGL103 n=1 Tax=Durio zibethinus TaxID=66656 RepID=A0A6P5YJY9_DURZI|nr:agamous-like MADS-box protein AGL103 [Durio zibethinus]
MGDVCGSRGQPLIVANVKCTEKIICLDNWIILSGETIESLRCKKCSMHLSKFLLKSLFPFFLSSKMGRGKLTMKFITKDKVRVSTYQKRKNGLTKKAQEFSILCGVETCIIIYGPQLKDSPAKLEIWPSDPIKVLNVINKYKAKPLEVRERKCFNVFDFFALRQKKLDDEIFKLRKANIDAKFSTWDDRINNFSVNQIWALLARFDSNLEAANKKIKMIKGKYQTLVEDSKSGMLAGPGTEAIQPRVNLFSQARTCLFQKNLDLEVTSRQQPMSGLNPFNVNMPSYYPFGSSEALRMHPFSLNPTDNSMTLLSRNGSDFTQMDGESSSSITYSSLSPQARYDPGAPMLDNVMFSNPWGVCFYDPFMQPMTPFGQSAMPSFPSQTDKFYRDIGDQYGSKSKKQK